MRKEPGTALGIQKKPFPTSLGLKVCILVCSWNRCRNFPGLLFSSREVDARSRTDIANIFGKTFQVISLSEIRFLLRRIFLQLRVNLKERVSFSLGRLCFSRAFRGDRSGVNDGFSAVEANQFRIQEETCIISSFRCRIAAISLSCTLRGLVKNCMWEGWQWLATSATPIWKNQTQNATWNRHHAIALAERNLRTNFSPNLRNKTGKLSEL